MRVFAALLAAAALTTAASAHVAAQPPGVDDPGSFPSWSPDGSRLRFSHGPDLLVLQVEGSRQRRLPRDGVWSPDGKRFAFVRSDKVYVADANGADPRQIAEGDDFSWSPDGRRLAIANTSLFVVDSDGTDLQQITTPAPCTNCYDRSHAAPSWSPRGDWIAFVDAMGHNGSHGSGTIRVVRPDGTGEQDVGGALFPSGISWSPDGNWLAYSDSADFSHATDFFVARESDGFRSRRVGNGDGGGTWAPTSRYLIRRSAGDLFVTRPEGGETRISKAAFPSWSPNGAQLAFQRGRSIFVGNPTGSSERLVTRGRYPNFSVRGTIAYVSLSCGAGQGIHVVRPDGRGDRRLTTACSIGGNYGPQAIWAGAEAQSVSAGAGNDLVHGEAGNDAISGDRGDDVLYGDTGNDVLDGGADVDRLYGGPGHDRLRSRDAWRDAVACGPGRDTVEADRVDLVAADCEVVRRR